MVSNHLQIVFFSFTLFFLESETFAQNVVHTTSLEPIKVVALIDEDTDKNEFISTNGSLGILGERSVLDVPFNFQSYTNGFIKNQQSSVLSDVVQNDASSSIGSAAGEYAEVFRIRGFTLLGDDISYGGLYGVLPRKTINTNLFDKVEIFKGANTFINGVPLAGSGVGGAINVTPKHATSPPHTRLNIGYENNNYGKVGLDISRRLGVNNNYGVRFSGNYESGEPSVDESKHRNISTVLGMDYKGQNLTSSIDIGYQKDTTKRGLMALGIKDPNGPGWGANYEDLKVPIAPKASSNYSPGWGFGTSETIFGMIKNEYTFSNQWVGYFAIGGNNHEEKTREASVDITNYAGDARTNQHLIHQNRESFSSQFGVRGTFNTKNISHKLNMGYSSIYSRVESAILESDKDYFTNIYKPNTLLTKISGNDFSDIEETPLKRRIRNEGISLSDEIGLVNDKLVLILGARYQKIDNIDYKGNSISNSYIEEEITPIYGVVFKINDYISLYGNHMESLQPADNAPQETASNKKKGLNLDNWGQSPGITKSTQSEMGLSYNFQKIGGNFSIFQIEQPQATVNLEGTHYDFYNQQRNRGFEFSINGSPRSDLRLYNSIMFIDPVLTKSESKEFEGNTAIGIPKYKLVLGGEWDIPNIEKLTVIGRFISTGTQYINQTNNLKLNSWQRFDMGARYITNSSNFGKTIWRLNLENIFNKNYWASAATDGSSRISLGEPRTLKLSATFDF